MDVVDVDFYSQGYFDGDQAVMMRRVRSFGASGAAAVSGEGSWESTRRLRRGWMDGWIAWLGLESIGVVDSFIVWGEGGNMFSVFSL